MIEDWVFRTSQVILKHRCRDCVECTLTCLICVWIWILDKMRCCTQSHIKMAGSVEQTGEKEKFISQFWDRFFRWLTVIVFSLSPVDFSYWSFDLTSVTFQALHLSTRSHFIEKWYWNTSRMKAVPPLVWKQTHSCPPPGQLFLADLKELFHNF